MSDALYKGDRQRRKELDMVRDLTSQAVLRKVRRITRRPRDTITGIFEGSVPTDDLRPEYMARIEHDEETDKMLTWSISELTTTHQLVAEGKAMHHCVRTYAHTCRRGSKAVFSLQICDAGGNSQRLMTIAVNPKGRRVTQARGKYNALPGGRLAIRSKSSLDDRYRHYLRRSRSVLRQWEQQEGLARSISI